MANTLNQIKVSGVTYDIVDSTAIHSLDGYYTSGQTNEAITAATSALAETIAEMNYATTGYVQDAVAEASGVTTGQVQTMIDNSVSGYADSVKYDSTAQEVKFYHGGTGGTEVFSFDASPFLIDGMVESVVITSVTSGASEVEVLQITWNSAAGGQVTNIPLSDIFNASNYYTTAQTDTKISEATSGKVDSSTYTAYTAATDTALSGKQETLVSGTNIKTVGGNSLLGSGDISFPSGLQVQVSGSTLVFG